MPTFGYSDEITMDALIELRKSLKAVASEKKVKLSFMPFFLKARMLGVGCSVHVHTESRCYLVY